MTVYLSHQISFQDQIQSISRDCQVNLPGKNTQSDQGVLEARSIALGSVEAKEVIFPPHHWESANRADLSASGRSAKSSILHFSGGILVPELVSNSTLAGIASLCTQPAREGGSKIRSLTQAKLRV